MKDAYRWDFFERDYTPVKISDGCRIISFDMNEEVTCPNCQKKFKYGDGYTSRRWHSEGGMGYSVCQECYKEEWQLEMLAKNQ